MKGIEKKLISEEKLLPNRKKYTHTHKNSKPQGFLVTDFFFLFILGKGYTTEAKIKAIKEIYLEYVFKSL